VSPKAPSEVSAAIQKYKPGFKESVEVAAAPEVASEVFMNIVRLNTFTGPRFGTIPIVIPAKLSGNDPETVNSALMDPHALATKLDAFDEVFVTFDKFPSGLKGLVKQFATPFIMTATSLSPWTEECTFAPGVSNETNTVPVILA